MVKKDINQMLIESVVRRTLKNISASPKDVYKRQQESKSQSPCRTCAWIISVCFCETSLYDICIFFHPSIHLFCHIGVRTLLRSIHNTCLLYTSIESPEVF